MPDPVVVTVMREWKLDLIAREDAQMRAMAAQWLQIEHSLEAQIAALADELARMRDAGEAISQSKLYRLERYRRLLAQVRSEFAGYVTYADREMSRYQSEMATLGLDHSVEAIQLSYWPGIGAYFDRLPVDAIENIVGLAGNGQPLGELLKARMIRDADGTELAGVWERLTQTLINGTVRGMNPRDVARLMRDDLAGGLNKALLIARTEGLRPYREMSRAQYEASGVVTGQKRLTAHDNRVCAACLADEGTLYGIHAIISDHPQGRCTSVPVVRDIPEVRWQAGEDWFRDQDLDTQRSILGPAHYKAWTEGAFAFSQLVTRTSDPVWGAGLTPTPLSELVGG